MKTDERVATWWQNFIKAYRPRSGVLPYHKGLAIQLDHRFGSKWLINKFHQLGYTESYSKIQRYKYCFLNDKNRVGITDDFSILGTIDEETDEQMDDEIEVVVDPVSVATTADENEEWSDDQVVSMEIADANSVTQFVGDNMNLNLVSIYGNSPFHTMGLIRVISLAPPSADDRAIIRVKLKVLDKTKILKATEVQILPFINRKQIGINAITFLPIAELSSSVMQIQPLLSPGDTLWTAGWVIKAQDSEFQQSTCGSATIVTFDLPIWLKAVDIIEQTNLPIISR